VSTKNNSNQSIFHVAVVSGKGGVGKTSITASLACEMNEMGVKLLTADTDVDAPNLAILFQAKGNLRDKFKVKTTEKSKFLPNLCIHCKRCIDEEFCHFGAISWNDCDMIPIIDKVACEGCRACNLLCPEKAFEIKSVNSGTISHLDSEYGFPVITGETILGAQTSRKLVTEMKKYAERVAKESDKEMILIDGPPGIGCPVIAAVADIQYAVVIVEPTKAALHDAKRVINVIKNFNTPIGVIVNKSDLWEKAREEILDFIDKSEIDLLGEIPLDEHWPHSIAHGLPIVKYKPDGVVRPIMQKIARKILKNKQKQQEKI